jgi:hypothetical protein
MLDHRDMQWLQKLKEALINSVYLCAARSAQMQGVFRRQWPGPWQEAEHRRCVLLAVPFGVCGLPGTRRCAFLT